MFLAAIFVAVFALLGWMSVAQVDRVVRVEGRIVPAGRAQQIQHLEGGIVAAIAAHEGDVVKKGDLLIAIDDTTAGANLGESQTKLASQKLRAARLEAEVAGASSVSFPAALAKGEAAAAEVSLFDSRKSKLEKETKIHQQAILQHQLELKDAESKLASLLDEKTVAKKRSEMVASMATRGAASQMELLEAQSREKRLETEIGSTQNAKPRLQAAIAEEEARISAMRADFRSSAQNELVAALADIDRFSNVVTAEADRMKRTEIKAPIDGVINRLAVNTVGGVVKPGESLVEITPTTQGSLIEARALPKDRGDLRAGLPAKIRVSAYDVGELGFLEGRVTEISPDTVQDPKGEAYFRVKILVDALPASYADKPLMPGMTALGDVVTGRRTLLSYLLSPFRKFTNNMFRDSR